MAAAKCVSALCFVFSLLLGAGHGQTYFQPEQVHISATDDVSEMVVTWTTMDYTPYSVVEYNKAGAPYFELQANGTVTKFIDGGSQHRTMYIHRVTLTGLTPTQAYEYHCGGPQGWSAIYKFNARRDGVDWSPRLAIFGDMGNKNAQSLPFLQEEVQRGDYDAIIHVGDFAYDMDSDDARFGDQFMRQLEPIAAYIPYMTCPGNHEQAYDESSVEARQTTRKSFRKDGEPGRRCPKPKHPLKVHVWAGISRKGATNICIFTGIMDSTFYQSILNGYLLPFIHENYPLGHRFQQDNDPKHVSHSTNAWMIDNDVNHWITTPESPDLNPIENLWALLKHHLAKYCKPRTQEQLVAGIRAFWETVTPEMCNAYINHLHKVIPAVVAANGCASGY